MNSDILDSDYLLNQSLDTLTDLDSLELLNNNKVDLPSSESLELQKSTKTSEAFTLDISTDLVTSNFSTNLNLAGIKPTISQDIVALNAFSGNTSKKVYTFGDDDRVLAGDTPWDQQIAFITVESPDGGGSAFTGALISPFHILTVAHGIYSKENGGFVDLDTIQVSLGQDGTQRHYGTANAVKYTYFTGYTDDSNWQLSGDKWQPKSFNDDMAIITLDRNIGNFTGWFGYKYNTNNSYFQDLTVNTAGYPSDLANSWSWNDDTVADVDLYLNSGPITEVNDRTFRYKLDIAGGQSGSPVWQYNSNTEERHIVGVHSFGSTSSNGASRITQGKFNKIQDTIEEEKQSLKPVDRPDFVDYDDWFDTDYAYFKNNETGTSSSSSNSIEITTGDSLTVRSVVRNNGTAAATATEVSFYASTDKTINSFDSHLGDVTLDSLDPFKWKDAILTTDLSNISAGNYYIGWVIDGDDVLDEFDETNNTGLLEDFTLTVKGTNTSNSLGSDNNDTLSGNDSDNSLIGYKGSDVLQGGAGNDTLTGSEPSVVNSGTGEYDRLTGGDGADIFVLGDAGEAYYQGAGYATITDFDWLEGDKIRVFGSASDYSLQEYTTDGGMDILYKGDLIGYVENTTNVLISSDFIFV